MMLETDLNGNLQFLIYTTLKLLHCFGARLIDSFVKQR